MYAALSDTGREQARDVFLRLIQPGEGTEDTRRRVAVSEITTVDDGPAAEVIREFVDAFLLTTSLDDMTGVRRVEIVHEAVITGWERCAQWVNDGRADLLVHRRLTGAAEEWKRRKRNPDVLYRGVALAEALVWRARTSVQLNWLEGDFLDAAEAQAHAQRRARRRWYTGGVVALLTALVVIAVVAVVAVVQRNVATSRQLAAEATATLDIDPQLSLVLALRAAGTAHTEQADAALRQATADSHGQSLAVGSGGPIYAARLLPDGRHVVTGSADGTVGLWDPPTGAPQRVVARHDDRVFAVRVTADGHTVVSGGRDGAVRLTRLDTGDSRVIFKSPVRVSNIELSHRGDLLATSLFDGTVHLIDLTTGQERAVLRGSDRIAYNLSFNSDDTLLAVADDDGTAQIWNVAARTQVRVLRSSTPVYGVAFSPSAPQVATAGADGKVRIWDVASGAALQELPVSTAELYFVRYSPDGERIAAAGLGASIYIWSTSGFSLSTLRGHTGAVLDFDFDESGKLLVSAGDDGTLRTWATADDQHLRAPVTAASFDPTGTRIISGGDDGHLRVWRRSDLFLLLDVPDHARSSYAMFAGDGSRIVSFADDGVVNIRDASGGRLLVGFAPSIGQIRTLRPNPDGTRSVIGSVDGKLAIFDDRGALVETLSESGSPINTATFTPDGVSVVAGRADGSVTLWGPDRHPVAIKPVNQQAVYDLDFDAAGTLLATADAAGSVDVWDRSGNQVAAMRGHRGPASAVRFRGDGEQLVSAGADGSVRVWNVQSGDPLMTFENSDGSATYLDVSPDGDTFVKSAEGTQAVRLLSCEVCGPLDAVMRLAHAREFRGLTPDEERRFAASG